MDFEMIGRLSMPKESDKFKPYEEKKFDSGWIRRSIKFNVLSGCNRHMMSIDEGCFEDMHNDVYTFTKGYTDDNGNKVKGEMIKIPFKERLTSDRLPEIAEFRKFIVDLEKKDRRKKLQTAFDNTKKGTSLTDDELKELGIESEEELESALVKSNQKRHEFISKWDFIAFIKKVLDSGKYSNQKFYIKGSVAYQYSEKNQKVYESFVPTRIYLADDDAEEYSTGTAKVYFNKDSLDDMSVDDAGKYYVNCYQMEYDQGGRKNAEGKTALIPVPTTIVIPCAAEDADEKAKKRVKATVKKFTCDTEEFREYGVIVDMLDGAQKVDIKLEDLDEDIQEDIECGFIELEDVIRDMGGSMYGDRIKELRFVKPARGFTKGTQESAYTPDDMVIKDVIDEDDDLFDDDDEI